MSLRPLSYILFHMQDDGTPRYPSVAIAILAAGASRRLGFPKQLVGYRGETMIEHVARVALSVGAGATACVTGCNHAEVEAAIQRLPLLIVRNDAWETGMSSSIAAAVKTFEAMEAIEAIVIMLADQPTVTPPMIDALVRRWIHSRAPIVASRQRHGRGVPALFSRPLFGELMALEGDTGARSVIERHGSAVEEVLIETDLIDLDEPADLALLVED